jgi:diguanylate cyclase (GGDEF)-like protein/PAS domain S-box-containing protein
MREENKETKYFEELFQSTDQASVLLMNANLDTFEKRLFKAMDIVAKAVNADHMYIWKNVLIDGKLHCTQLYEWSEEAEPFQNAHFTVLVPYDEVFRDLKEPLSNGRSVNSLTRNMSPEMRERLEKQGILSILIEPVFIAGEFWGFVGFDDCHKERVFTAIEDRMLRSSSLLFGHALHHNEAMRLIHEQNEFQHVMFNEAPIGLAIFDEQMNVIECNPTLVEMFDTSKEKIIENFFGFSPEYQNNGMNSKDQARELFRRAMNGEIPKTEWTHLLPDGKLLPCELTLEHINRGDKSIVLGFIYDLSKIKNLESEVGSLKEKTYEDPLTGIYNRRFLDEKANQITKSLMPTNAQLSILMLDIDLFKEYNDHYGHQKGDECLKAVAHILSESISRAGDLVIRYGGEEFVIVLPSTDAKKACLVAEKIIENMRKANIPHEYSHITNHVTLSIGVTTGIMEDSLTVDNFVKVADDMLYASKKNGRNRYTFREMGKN